MEITLVIVIISSLLLLLVAIRKYGKRFEAEKLILISKNGNKCHPAKYIFDAENDVLDGFEVINRVEVSKDVEWATLKFEANGAGAGATIQHDVIFIKNLHCPKVEIINNNFIKPNRNASIQSSNKTKQKLESFSWYTPTISYISGSWGMCAVSAKKPFKENQIQDIVGDLESAFNKFRQRTGKPVT